MKVLKSKIQAKERSLSFGTLFDLSDNHCGGDQSFSENDYTLSALVNSSQKQQETLRVVATAMIWPTLASS